MSALMLRIIACLAMLIDHIGFQYNIYMFRCIGRIAFPIFVFLICNGYRHTSGKLRYALRLTVFSLLSQIPFSLFCYNSLWNRHGNVFVTLLFSLICIWTYDVLICKTKLRFLAFLPTVLVCALYYFGFLDSDYGIRGILFALVFYFFCSEHQKKPWRMVIGMLLAIYYPFLLGCIKWIFGGMAPSLINWELTQMYSLLAIPLILSYNGEKGITPTSAILAKLTQLGFYIFYPAHMLVLWLIRVF